ncbi:MAG TPA: Holliday junction branch migration protein RuvA [Chitinophagaceae bacterium]|nr:Holliday junction branch migration protein RuvA [Chitinophagaceae bacterium]HRA10984.1 Holliday junction branch migration protein RuvA [Chitinophagaceae bacterium]
MPLTFNPISLFSQPMIAYLKGDFVHKSPATVQVDVNGVGYEVQISLHTYSKIQNLDKGILQTVLLIREDAHILYGFFDLAEKEMFLYLISVSGVGASTARVMLSYMKPDELASAIIQGDTKTLEGIKGIGKKSAERLVVELRDKLAKQPLDSNISPLKNNTLQQDALNALTALGIARQQAGQAIEKTIAANPNLSVEELIKLALRTL